MFQKCRKANRRSFRVLASLCYSIICLIPLSVFSQADTLCGRTVATCYATTFSGDVGVIYDSRMNSLAPPGNDWATVPEIHPSQWKRDIIGNVFGIALDAQGEIYLAASDIYHYDATVAGLLSVSGPGGTAGIYKTNINLPNVTTTIVTTTNAASLPAYNTGNSIPNAGGLGNGIGNIAYDPVNNQLFLTNMEDGLIYRISTTGNLLSAFDPFGADSQVAGFQEKPDERIWGIAVHQGRVYFAREESVSNPKEVWSIGLTGAEFASTSVGTGLFAGGEVLEVSATGFEEKFTDIAIAADGRMLCAERGGAHTAAIFEYENTAGWVSTGIPYFVGHATGKNSGGGVDYGYKEDNGNPTALCDAFVLATGNCMGAVGISSPPNCDIYGIQFIAETGNAAAPSNSATDLYIDFNHTYGSDQKYQVGDVEQFFCGCPPSSSICESIAVDSKPSPVQADSCCFVLNLQNQVADYFTGVQLCSSSGVSISAVGALNGWTIAGYSSSFLALVPPGPPGAMAQIGNQDFIKFCLSNYDNQPTQEILVKYYGPDETLVCVDTLIYDCFQQPKCISVSDSVSCGQNGQYDMSFCITSDALIGFDVNSVQLNAPPGITFTPNVFSVANLMPGQTQCGFTTSVAGALDGQSFCYSVTAHKEDVNVFPPISPTECCTDTLMLGCVTMPDCICTNIAATAQEVQMQGDTCCWQVDLTNNYSNSFFSGVELNIITPGVVFGAIVNPFGSGWSSTSSSTQVLFEPKPLGSFISATSTLPTFCLSGINGTAQVPQEVTISWLDPDGKTVCTDTLTFDCQPPVNAPCAELLNWEVLCDENNPGVYTLNFQVKNNSSFTANQVDLSGIAAPAFVFTNFLTIPPLAPGMTSPVLTTEIYGLVPGDSFYFNLTLHEIASGSELNCCTNSQQYCLPMPQCPNDGCACGAFTNVSVSLPNSPNSIPFDCGGDAVTFDCKPNTNFVFAGDFLCQGSNCDTTATFDWSLVDPTNQVIASATGVPASPDFSFDVTTALFDQMGEYCLQLSGRCGSEICTCNVKFYIKNPCPTTACCSDFEAFCADVENATNIMIDEEVCKAKLTIDTLPDCAVVQWVQWGDGQQDQGNFTTGDMPMHVYASSGTYVVSWLAVEQDPATGIICHEKILTDTITINCTPSCCADFDFFCNAVDGATQINIDDALCKATLVIDTLNSCDAIQWVQWGDGGQSQGSFTTGDMPMHVYSTNGTYIVSWLAVELDANGNICFEKTLTDTITINCASTCCQDFDIFCQAAEYEVQTTVDNEACKVTTTIGGDLSDCISIQYIDWGTNPPQVTQGPFTAGDMAMNIYSASGTYIISYQAIELDNNGAVCFEKILTDTITVDCYNCCQGQDLFCASVESTVDAVINNDSCKITLAIGDLPSCDFIEYVNWGSNPPAQSTGPFYAGDMPMHTYPAGGTYYISYLVSEQNADGSICEEKIFRDTLVLECTVGTEELLAQEDISIFPNPTTGELNLQFAAGSPADFQLEIIDIWGRKLHSALLPIGEGDHQLSLEHYPAGIYFIGIMDEGRAVWSEKIIKQ